MLLVEYTVLDKLQVINEGTKGNKRLKVVGKFQKCDEQNNNGRVYPRKILESQVKAIQEKIGERSLVGALDHPANDAIHLSQASHLVTKLWVEKNGDVMGEAEILSTPNGKIVEALLQDDVKIGISSRGLGSVSEGTTGKVVNEDFKLITFDLVSDPSTKGAFPSMCESMRENSERAQAIVSKHKKDRVLMTMLESKIKEALNEARTSDQHMDDIANATDNSPRQHGHGRTANQQEAGNTRKRRRDAVARKAAKKAAAATTPRKTAPTVTITGHGGEVATDADPLTVDGQTQGHADTQQNIPRYNQKKSKRVGAKKDSQNSSTEIVTNHIVKRLKSVCEAAYSRKHVRDNEDNQEDQSGLQDPSETKIQGRFTGPERGYGETPQAHGIRMGNQKPKPKPKPKPIPGISGDTSKLTTKVNK